MPTSSISVQVNDIACVIPEKETLKYLLSSGVRKVNYYESRPGMEYGSGKFLLSKSDLDSINSQNVSVSFKSRTDGVITSVDFRDLIVAETSMIMTPVEKQESLFLVTLVDRRYYSSRDFIGVTNSFFPTTNPQEQHVDAKDNWQEILAEYWSHTPLNSITLDQSEAEYPARLMKDVEYEFPTSALQVMTDVLKMIGHDLFVTTVGTSTSYRILPLKRVIASNTVVLQSEDTLQRRIQTKSNRFISRTFIPSSHNVFFRPERFNDAVVKFNVNNPNGGGSFERNTTVFNCISSQTEMQEFSNQISALVFDGYATANQVDSIYFGLIKVEHSPSCYYIEYFYDLQTQSFKTKIRSHKTSSSARPPFKQESELLKRFILTEDLTICGRAEGKLIVGEDCDEIADITLVDTTGQAFLNQRPDGSEYAAAGSMGFARTYVDESSDESSDDILCEIISLGVGMCCDDSSSSSESSESENESSSESSASSEMSQSSNSSESLSSDSESNNSESSDNSDDSNESSESSLSSESDESVDSSDSQSSESDTSSESSEASEPSEDSNNQSSDPSSASDDCEFDQIFICPQDGVTFSNPIIFPSPPNGQAVIFTAFFQDANGFDDTALVTVGVRCDQIDCVNFTFSSDHPPLRVGNHPSCCDPSSDLSSSSSESSSLSESSDSEECFMPFDVGSLPIFKAREIDGVLALKGGCLGFVPVTRCSGDESSGGV